ncbi:MAG: hypothetical protein JWM10_3 [Myxococcaceae bacterium]|nr:hypothetical protein [Myxococcaceae bacterium]
MPLSSFEPAPGIIDEVLASLAAASGVLRPTPTPAQLRALIEAAFWASLYTDEGRQATFALAWGAPFAGPGQLRFAASLPVSPASLAQLSPALRTGQMLLGVAPSDEGFVAWGILDSDAVGHPLFVVEVLGPGLIVVRYGARNLALFARDRAELVDHGRLNARHVLQRVFGAELSDAERLARGDALARVAGAMRALGYGGALLLVRGAHRTWERSLQQPLRYAASPGSDVLHVAVTRSQASSADGASVAIRAELARSVAFTASLSAVDGAVILDDSLRVLGFGATISAHDEPATVMAVRAVGQLEPTQLPFDQLGGTRHQSAARFVWAERDAAAVVASHDGEVTVLAWVEELGQVVAIQQSHASLL